jgi:hypothetical protein
MKTSISLAALSRSNRIVDAGRGAMASVDMNKSLLVYSWFETREDALLTMRILILRSGRLAASRRMRNVTASWF